MSRAFTLAEVLITLGIIGIVAAMTLPTVISNNKKKTVEARLQKFYSVANQAIKLSELKNGPKELWKGCKGGYTATENKMACSDWYNIYLRDYLKTTKIEHFTNKYQYTLAYFPDGSLMVLKSGYDIFYYPFAKDYNEAKMSDTTRPHNGKQCFMFTFIPNSALNNVPYSKGKGIEPYKNLVCENKTDSNGNKTQVCNNITKEELQNNSKFGCNSISSSNRAYCTAFIQLNNWQIPENYPFKL